MDMLEDLSLVERHLEATLKPNALGVRTTVQDLVQAYVKRKLYNAARSNERALKSPNGTDPKFSKYWLKVLQDSS